MSAMLRKLAAAGAVALVAACGDGSGSGTTQVVVQLTDAPSGAFASAKVWISSVYLVPGADSSGPRFIITETPHEYDLLDLRNGVLATLGSAAVPVGDYQQVRLVVDSARVTLADPMTFHDGSDNTTLRVPSGQQTGIKVTFSGGPIHVGSSRVTVLIDFDVARNFVLTGPPDVPTGALFTPLLHGVVTDIAASIGGTVSPATTRATVYGIIGTDTVQTATADTVTGAYLLRYLPPGTYTVTAIGVNLLSTKTVTVRAGQDTTGVNFP